MIVELARLELIPGKSEEFERAFAKAVPYIRNNKGYIEHHLYKYADRSDTYLLEVKWASISDHSEGFRLSENYKHWKELLHHFYDPFPIVEYYHAL